MSSNEPQFKNFKDISSGDICIAKESWSRFGIHKDDIVTVVDVLHIYDNVTHVRVIDKMLKPYILYCTPDNIDILK